MRMHAVNHQTEKGNLVEGVSDRTEGADQVCKPTEQKKKKSNQPTKYPRYPRAPRD